MSLCIPHALILHTEHNVSLAHPVHVTKNVANSTFDALQKCPCRTLYAHFMDVEMFVKSTFKSTNVHVRCRVRSYWMMLPTVVGQRYNVMLKI